MSVDQSLQAAVSLLEILTLEIEKVQHGDFNETLRGIALAGRNIFEAQVCTIVAIDPISQNYYGPLVSRGVALPEEAVYAYAEKLRAQQELNPQENFLLVREAGAGGESDPAPGDEFRTVAAALATTQRRRRPLAVILLGFKESPKFDLDLKILLRMFTERVASVLYNTWSLSRYNRVARIGQEINQSLRTVELLFPKLTNNIKDILDISYCFMLAVYNQQSDTLDCLLLDGGEYKEFRNLPMDGASAHVIRNPKTLFIKHLSREADKLPVPLTNLTDAPADPESLIFVPLVFRDSPLGVISVQQLPPNAYSDGDQIVLELLAHHVALALHNLRLFENLDQLNETGQRLLKDLNSDHVLGNIAEQIRETTQSDIVNLFPYSKITQSFVFPPRSSGLLLRPDVAPPNFSRPDDIASLALKKGTPVYARDSLKLFEKLGGGAQRLGFFERREGIRSTAVLPLRVGDEAVGVLFVNFRKPQTFDAPQRRLIETLSSYAALAIKNSREFNAQARRHEEELRITRDFDAEISRTLNLQTVMRRFLELTSDYLGGDYGGDTLNAAILIYNPAGNELEVREAHGSNADLRRGKTIPLAEKKGYSYLAYSERRPVHVNNVRADPRSEHYYEVDARTVSELDVPLLDENREALGVISYESSREKAFTQSQLDFIVMLAERAVLAIRNAQTHEQTQRLVREMQRLTAEMQEIQSVEQAIIKLLTFDRVFPVILNKALKITGAAAGLIMLHDERRGDLYTVAHRGGPPEETRGRLPLSRGIIGHVVRTRQWVNVNVCEEGSEWQRMYVPFIPGVRWELAVPMLEDKRVRGVINIEKTLDEPFSDLDVRLLRRLADLAMIALQITERYKRAESGKDRLRRLHEVDKEIIKQLAEPDQVMRMVLESALVLTNAETGDLHLYEGGKLGTTYFTSRENDKILDAVRKDGAEAEQFVRGIVAHVAETRQTYRTTGDAQDDERYRGKKDVHSEVTVPLKSGDELIGVINLESRERQAFSDDDEWLLDLFAGQAVIAIQKARAYRQAKEESDRFRWLSEAGQELGEIPDLSRLNQAYEVVLRIVRENNDAQAVIRRFEPETGRLILKKVSRPREVPPFKAIEAGDVKWLKDRKERTIVIPRVRELADTPRPKISDPAINSLVVTAIESGNNYYGILALSHEQEDYFKEADVKLMEGLAYQLAITISRLETAQAQKEAERRANDARLMSSIGKLVIDVTHRLGNDLPAALARVERLRKELAKSGALTAKVGGYLDGIQASIEKSRNLTRRLRDDAAEKYQMNREPVRVAIRTLIEEATQTLAEIPANILLVKELDEDVSDVRVEPREVYNALHNLVTNAIQAMPGGGQLTIRAKNAGRKVQVEIADTGPGISKDEQSKIFDLFYTTRAGEGHGVGLWSARHDIDSNRGELRVSSEPGRGATFIITLPKA